MSEENKEAPVDNKTKPVFYFDWNVISYLHDSSKLDYEHRVTILCLTQILGLIDRLYISPFSYAHLSDIRQGPKNQHANWLNYLEKTTDGWQVKEMFENRDKVVMHKSISIKEEYNKYDSDQTETEKRQSKNKKLLSPMIKTARDKILREMDKNENHPNSKILLQALHMFSDEKLINGLNIMRFNNETRKNLYNENGVRIRYPDAKSRMKRKLKKPFRDILDESILKSGLPWKTYDELEKTIPFIGTGGFLSPFMEKVNRLSIIANMVGIGLEKMKKDTSFKGLVNDLGHLALGLRCNYFIAEDSALIEKALFIKSMLELPVVVLKMEGFNQLLLYQIAPYYVERGDANKTEDCTETTFRFNDQKGNIIRTYIVETK